MNNVSVSDTPMSRWFLKCKSEFFRNFGGVLIIIGIFTMPFGLSLMALGGLIIYCNHKYWSDKI